LTISSIKKIIRDNIEENHQVNVIKYFDTLRKEQQERSRAASKMTGDVFTDAELNLDVPKTVFCGCEHHDSKSKIIKIFSGSDEIKAAKKGDNIKVVLDKTPFYAEAGGQIGDTGMIIKKGGSIKITDTQRIADIFIHLGTIEEGTFKLNDPVEAQIDAARRFSIMRNHTATHLMQAGLRSVLGSHVKQQGSLVTEDRLRFDFTHPKAVTRQELDKIELLVNKYILSCEDVKKKAMSIDEARQKGALAFFAEKYGEKVSVVSVGDYSKELCGGTHLETVGQIGLFKIISESAIAQGIRRIEAKTGSGALEYTKEREKQLEDVARLLKAPSDEIVDRLQAQTKRIKELEKALGQLRFEAVKHSLKDIIEKAPEVKKIKIIHHIFSETPVETLRKIADTIKQKAKSSVIALGSQNSAGAFIIIAVTEDVIKNGVRANDLINEVAPLIKGSGGGRPQLAQAGSKDAANLKNALEMVEKIVKEKL